jgi:Tfp pilus assembly protein PilF
LDFSKEANVTFDPRDRAHRRKLWVRVAARDGAYHHVYWRRVAGGLAVLALAGWLALAGAAWGYLKFRRAYDGVRYLDLVFYPWRRAEHQAGLGHHYIASGRAAWERQAYREAYALLLAGLARVPGDITARRYLAIIESRIGRPERARQTLIAGVAHARGDLDYLKLLFAMLLEAQEDEQAIALAQELLPAAPDRERAHQFIALQAATAHYHRGRPAEAERLVAEWGLQRNLEAQLLLARCEWQRGQRELALARLERAVPEFRRRDELYVELVRLNRELGRPAEARRYAMLRQFNNPGSAGARIDLLHTYRLAGDTAEEARELAAYLAAFSKDQPGLVLLAWFAVDTAQPALAAQAHALAREQKLPLAAFDLARAQALLAATDYAGALALTESLARATPPVAENIAVLLGALRAVALYGSGDPGRGQVALSAFVESPRVRANDLLLIARQLVALGHAAPARRVLARASELDRRNEPVLAELVQLDTAAGDRVALAENLPRLLPLRQHHRATLEATLRTLTEPADAPLRQQIEAALARVDGH